MDLCGFVERMSQKYEHVIGDPQMLSHDSQTEFSVLQIENYIYNICKKQHKGG